MHLSASAKKNKLDRSGYIVYIDYMKRFIYPISIILLLVISGTLSAAETPKLILHSYDQIIDFTKKETVLIQKGDNREYSNPAYDDSSWKRVSLPVNSNRIFKERPEVCWYRIHIIFPGGLPDSTIGISLGIISDTDEVYFNGTRIGSTGSETPVHVSAYDKKRIYELPVKLIIPDGENIIAMRVKGFFREENGPVKGKFMIAPLLYLQKKFASKEIIDIFFIGIYLIVGLYFIFIFAVRSIDREYLYFAIFTLTSALYMFLQTQVKYYLFDNFLVLKRVEYIALFFIPLLVMEYITSFFSKKHTLIHYLYIVIAVCSSLVVIFSGNIHYWRYVLLYAVEPFWLLTIGYCLFITFREIKNDPNAKYLLASFIFMWLVFISDALNDRNIINTMRFSTYAFLVVITGTAIIMLKHFKAMYSDADEFRNRRRGVTSVSKENKKKVDTAIAYIKENYRSEISREGLASLADVHHDYFGKLFLQTVGMKINDYINLLRINEAAGLLLGTDQKVIDIAYSVGFESLSTFYRVFQSIKGVTPTEWQEKAKQKNIK